jgi:hypothetical protein
MKKVVKNIIIEIELKCVKIFNSSSNGNYNFYSFGVYCPLTRSLVFIEFCFLFSLCSKSNCIFQLLLTLTANLKRIQVHELQDITHKWKIC